MGELISDVLRVRSGAVDLAEYDPEGKPGFDGKKAAGEKALAELGPQVSELQERLYAGSRGGKQESVLLVLQGMDTSGKGGVMRHAVGLLDPQGVQITAFKAPTEDERTHDFLWRIEKKAPKPGLIGIFDRSHYEDVLIGRVRQLASPEEIERRYDAINDFETRLVEAGTTVVKCMLHISKAEQGERLLARLDDPTKHWKFNPDDIDERALWDDYQHAYEIALERCNTEAAPWYVVPSNRKWYRSLAITKLLLEHLTRMDPQWPKGDFDVEEQRARLAVSCMTP